MAHDRLDLAETAKHLAQRMSEPREFDFIPLKRAALHLVKKPKKLHCDSEDKNTLTKITVFEDSDFAGDPVSRKKYSGIGGSDWESHSEIWICTSELDSRERARSEVYAVVKGSQVGLSLRSIYMNLGIPMKVETQSDKSPANSLTDRLGARPRTILIDTRYLWVRERVQDADLSIKKVPTAKKCATIANLRDWYSADNGSHTPLQDGWTSVESSRRRRCRT